MIQTLVTKTVSRLIFVLFEVCCLTVLSTAKIM
jgi:hypothetical protein